MDYYATEKVERISGGENIFYRVTATFYNESREDWTWDYRALSKALDKERELYGSKEAKGYEFIQIDKVTYTSLY